MLVDTLRPEPEFAVPPSWNTPTHGRGADGGPHGPLTLAGKADASRTDRHGLDWAFGYLHPTAPWPTDTSPASAMPRRRAGSQGYRGRSRSRTSATHPFAAC